MGQQVDIRVAQEVEWPKLAALLHSVHMEAVVRMIDGLPAFPDELPEAGWKELRVSMPGGMVTLRREAGIVSCVVWGNAEAELIRSWQACAWAVAQVGLCVETADLPEWVFNPPTS